MKIGDAYESMFGCEDVQEPEYFMPNVLPMGMNRPLVKKVMQQAKREKKWVLAFVIGTKPCFYKFYGSIVEAKRQNVPFFIINSGQHYDNLLTHGINEFSLTNYIGSNLAIRGDLAQKSAELMIKASWLGRSLKKEWPGVTVIPVVLGDTIATGIVPAAWMFSRNEKAIQNEAGLRSMTPSIMREAGKIEPAEFIEKQFNGPWEILRNEPFPEQWDTFVSAAGSEFLFAPHAINKGHLLREGYPEENIWVTGGVVVDALELKRKEKPKKSIFSIYPQLEHGEWLRVDIHRRENLTPTRFKAIIGGVKELVEKGYKVNFIEMSASRQALEAYKLKNVLKGLEKRKNFLYTKIWPEYAHVIEFFDSEHCFAAFTDSGGVQEEMNLIDKVCLTCRFNTDRPETVKEAKSNVLVPPINKEFIAKMVGHVYNDESLQKSMKNSPSIYGKDVAKQFISIISDLMEKNEYPFKWAHEALGLWKEDKKGIDYL